MDTNLTEKQVKAKERCILASGMRSKMSIAESLLNCYNQHIFQGGVFMRTIKMLSVILGILIFSGCVSSQEHKAALGDIENLKKISQPWKKSLRQKKGRRQRLNQSFQS